MRSDIDFKSNGATCRGWLYRPEGAKGPTPAIVMSHGFSAVKEMGLAEFAEGFCKAGFIVMAFDYRFLGASDGQPRGRIIPDEQHDDLRAALDWICAQPGVDPARIGMWGSSYAGGHSIYMGAYDPRVKVVVAQVPAMDPGHAMRATAGREVFEANLQMLLADHAARNAGKPPGEIAIVAPEGEPCILAGQDCYDWFQRATAGKAPNWLNRTSLESVARLIEYAPANFIDFVAPKPLLVIAATGDSLIPIADMRAFFARAGEPKTLVELDCGHFDVYPGERCYDDAARLATDWFKTHL